MLLQCKRIYKLDISSPFASYPKGLMPNRSLGGKSTHVGSDVIWQGMDIRWQLDLALSARVIHLTLKAESSQALVAITRETL
jgi:hypothetical protein